MSHYDYVFAHYALSSNVGIVVSPFVADVANLTVSVAQPPRCSMPAFAHVRNVLPECVRAGLVDRAWAQDLYASVESPSSQVSFCFNKGIGCTDPTLPKSFSAENASSRHPFSPRSLSWCCASVGTATTSAACAVLCKAAPLLATPLRHGLHSTKPVGPLLLPGSPDRATEAALSLLIASRAHQSARISCVTQSVSIDALVSPRSASSSVAPGKIRGS